MAAKVLDQMLGNADNPIRLEIESIARNSGLTMILNTVMNSDGSIAKVVAGDLVAAHREGVKYAQMVYCAEIPVTPDVMVVNAYPGCLDLWQTGKGMTAGAMLLKPGGDMIKHLRAGRHAVLPSYPR
jgi:nickel-dependent lactate racemase